MRVPIYFSASISGGRSDVPLYRRIVDHLSARGHRIYAEHVADASLRADGETVTPEEIFRRDLDWIEEVAKSGGALVAEVSMPSIGVGYEIAAARYRFGMPVVCLYRPAHTRRCSAMVSGDREITLLAYEEDSLDQLLDALGKRLDETRGATSVRGSIR
ncbi:MAG: nucleoside 2-deoxyribosyltransferase [Thermoanaerobaculia bacterium]